MNNVVIKDFVKDLVNEGILYSVVCGNYDLYFVANDNKLHIEKNGDEICVFWTTAVPAGGLQRDAVSASAEGAESTDNAAGYPQYGAALQG